MGHSLWEINTDPFQWNPTLTLSSLCKILSLEELKQRQQRVCFLKYNPSNSWSLRKKERMSKNLVRENVPLSRFGVLVAQLESIGASASQQSPDPLLSFDLLSDLLSAIDEEPQVLSFFFLLFLKRRVL